MSIPTGLPTLKRGGHKPSDGEACAMEYVSVIAGLEFGADPVCTDPVVRDIVISVNDRILDDDYRCEMLMPLLHRIASCPPVENSDIFIGNLMRSRGAESSFPVLVDKPCECGHGGCVTTSYGPDSTPSDYVTNLVERDQASPQGIVVKEDATKAVEFIVEVLDLLDKARGTVAPEPYTEEFLSEVHAKVLALA